MLDWRCEVICSFPSFHNVLHQIQTSWNCGFNVSQSNSESRRLLCDAYAAVGDAFMCEKDHPERNVCEAVKWYTKCVDEGDIGAIEHYEGKLKSAGQYLSGSELDAVLHRSHENQEAEVQSHHRFIIHDVKDRTVDRSNTTISRTLIDFSRRIHLYRNDLWRSNFWLLMATRYLVISSAWS